LCSAVGNKIKSVSSKVCGPETSSTKTILVGARPVKTWDRISCSHARTLNQLPSSRDHLRVASSKREPGV
jgi:hypothetical protein